MQNKTWWMSCVGDKNKPIIFWLRSHADPYQWETKQTAQPGGSMHSTECRSSSALKRPAYKVPE